MSDFQIFVTLRRDSKSSQLKRFAKALDAWREESEAAGIAMLLDPVTMQDLDNGELPMPLAVRECIGPFRIPAEHVDLAQQHGGDISAVTVDDRERHGVGFGPPKPGAVREARKLLGKSAELRGVRIVYPREVAQDRNSILRLICRHLPSKQIDCVFIDGNPGVLPM